VAATFTGKLAKKAWVFFVIVAIICITGTIDYRLHGVFGSDHRFSNGGPQLEEPRNLHPKHVRYEIFGPAGTTARISYMDENANARLAVVQSLPWSVEFTMTQQTSVLNVMAQGDSDSLGCRITVNDEVKDEYVARLPFAQTYCEDKTAS
jgi:hypothetical protein